MKLMLLLACAAILLIALFPPRIGIGVYYDRNSSMRADSGARFQVSRPFLFADSYRLSRNMMALPGGGEKVFHEYAQIDAGRLLGEIAAVGALAGIGLILLGAGRPRRRPNRSAQTDGDKPPN